MIGLLIRHGHVDSVGVSLTGRRSGIALNDVGRVEADRLRQALTWAPLTAIYSSPLQRAIETALPTARDHGLNVCIRDDLTDVDFGDWTGKTFEELADDRAWRSFNEHRENACPPGGESLVNVQRRILLELFKLSVAHADEMVALISHAEPIRCAVAALSRRSLDEALAIEILPARVSMVGIQSGVRQVLAVNVEADEAIAGASASALRP